METRHRIRLPWEAEALELIRAALPGCDPYYGWTNFSFIADDGTVNEVDALIATPSEYRGATPCVCARRYGNFFACSVCA